MNARLDRDQLSVELGGWALRGVLCAAASVFWALVAGFDSPAEHVGMAAGVAAWVAIFAGLCAWRGEPAWLATGRFPPALKVAAWIKFALSASGWLLYGASALLRQQDLAFDAGFLFVIPDCLFGALAMNAVSWVSGIGPDQLAKADSFGWTALTTFVDGILFALAIGLLAAAVLTWWWLGPRLFRKPLFPPVSART